MAFCNSCGTNLQTGAKFCPKCGTAVPAVAAPAPPAPAAVAPPVQPSQGGSAVKVILIVVAIIFGLGILAAGSLSFVAWHIARHSHVRGTNGEVHVETPFGTVDTTEDPQQVARNIGVDIYPGASVVKHSNADVAIGSMHTSAVNFETSDPVEKCTTSTAPNFPMRILRPEKTVSTLSFPAT